MIPLLIDENIFRRLLPSICILFPESAHIVYEGLEKATDKKIWDYAKDKGYCLLTKDRAFSFMSALFGCPPKVIRLNCGNQNTLALMAMLELQFSAVVEFFREENACYLEIKGIQNRY